MEVQCSSPKYILNNVHPCKDYDKICHFFCNDYFEDQGKCDGKNKYAYIDLITSDISTESFNRKCKLDKVLDSALKKILGNHIKACATDDDLCRKKNKLYTEFKEKFIEKAIIKLKHVCDTERDEQSAYLRAKKVYDDIIQDEIKVPAGTEIFNESIKTQIINEIIVRNFRAKDPYYCKCGYFGDQFSLVGRLEKIQRFRERCQLRHPECGFGGAIPCHDGIHPSFRVARSDFASVIVDGNPTSVTITLGGREYEARHIYKNEYHIHFEQWKYGKVIVGTDAELIVAYKDKAFIGKFKYMTDHSPKLCKTHVTNSCIRMASSSSSERRIYANFGKLPVSSVVAKIGGMFYPLKKIGTNWSSRIEKTVKGTIVSFKATLNGKTYSNYFKFLSSQSYTLCHGIDKREIDEKCPVIKGHFRRGSPWFVRIILSELVQSAVLVKGSKRLTLRAYGDNRVYAASVGRFGKINTGSTVELQLKYGNYQLNHKLKYGKETSFSVTCQKKTTLAFEDEE